MNMQADTSFDSDSGLREAFDRIIGTPPADTDQAVLNATWLDSPLGPLLAIATEKQLVLLEFAQRRGLEEALRRLRGTYAIVPGMNGVLMGIKRELTEYFAGERTHFQTPLKVMAGTDFQRRVWEELQRIPYGEAISYMELARRIGRPNAFRAVARANGANQLAVIIPCHRVINADGRIGGYGGGVPRKEWLLDMESRAARSPQGLNS